MNKVLLLPILCLSACGMYAPTEVALRNGSYKASESYCHEGSVDTIAPKVASYLNQCFQTINEPGMNITYDVEETGLPNGKQFTVHTQYGYTLGADVTAGDTQCQVKLQMYAINGLIARYFKPLNDNVGGAPYACPHW